MEFPFPTGDIPVCEQEWAARAAINKRGFAACASFDVVVDEVSGGVRFPVEGLRPGDPGQPGRGGVRADHARRDPLQHRRLPDAAAAAGIGARRPVRRNRCERPARRAQPDGRADRRRRRAADHRHRPAWGRSSAAASSPPARRLRRHAPGTSRPPTSCSTEPHAGRLDDRPEPGLAGDHADPHVERLTSPGDASRRSVRGQGPQAHDQLPAASNRGHGHAVSCSSERGAFGTNVVGSHARRRAGSSSTPSPTPAGGSPARARAGRDRRPTDSTARRSAATRRPRSGAARQGPAPARASARART